MPPMPCAAAGNDIATTRKKARGRKRIATPQDRAAQRKRPDARGTRPFFRSLKKTLDGFLQFLGGAERDLLGRLDLDRFASGGIATHARTALAHDQDAQAVQKDAGAPLQMLGDQTDS